MNTGILKGSLAGQNCEGETTVRGGGRSASRRYISAVLCVLIAFAVRYFFTPLLGDELPLML